MYRDHVADPAYNHSVICCQTLFLVNSGYKSPYSSFDVFVDESENTVLYRIEWPVYLFVIGMSSLGRLTSWL